MAGEDGNATADLIARAGEAPAEAEVFQLVRLILEAGRQAGEGRAQIGGRRPAGL